MLLTNSIERGNKKIVFLRLKGIIGFFMNGAKKKFKTYGNFVKIKKHKKLAKLKII